MKIGISAIALLIVSSGLPALAADSSFFGTYLSANCQWAQTFQKEVDVGTEPATTENKAWENKKVVIGPAEYDNVSYPVAIQWAGWADGDFSTYLANINKGPKPIAPKNSLPGMTAHMTAESKSSATGYTWQSIIVLGGKYPQYQEDDHELKQDDKGLHYSCVQHQRSTASDKKEDIRVLRCDLLSETPAQPPAPAPTQTPPSSQ